MNFSQLGFGLFSLKIYGILFSILFTILIWKYYKELQKQKFPTDFFVHHFWKWLLVGVLGGRIFQLILTPELILNHGFLSFFVFWEGDGIHFLSFCGAFFYMLHRETKDTQFSCWRWLDVVVPFLLIGVLGEDIISFLTGNTYGTPTNLPWAIQYETFAVDIVDPVHPVPLYAFILHLGVYFWTQKHTQFYLRTPGRLFRITALLLLTIDFFMLFLRGDSPNIIGGFLKADHILYLIGIGALLVYIQKQKLSITKRSK